MPYYACTAYDLPTIKAQLLAAIQERGGNWLALVDTAFDPESKAQSRFPEILPIYHEGRFAALREASPSLVGLSTANGQALEKECGRLLRHCQGRPMLAFIQSGNSIQSVRQNWQSVLEIETSDGQPFLLRFADTRVTPMIAGLLQDSAWPRLCDGVEQWLCINREGELQALPLAVALSGADAGKQERVRIDDKTLARILDAGQADALANQLFENFPEILPADQGALVHRRLQASCELAKKNGIDSSADLMALAVSVCITDGALLTNASFGAWLGDRPWASGNFAEALGQWMEANT